MGEHISKVNLAYDLGSLVPVNWKAVLIEINKYGRVFLHLVIQKHLSSILDT